MHEQGVRAANVNFTRGIRYRALTTNRSEASRLCNSMLELSRILRQPVKTQIPLNGELCHGVVAKNVHA